LINLRDDVVGLKRGYFVYLSERFKTEKGNIMQIWLRNIKTGKVKMLQTYGFKNIQTGLIRIGDFDGKVYMGRTKEDALILSFNFNNDILLYSWDGKLQYSFNIKLRKRVIDSKQKNAFKNYILRVFKKKNPRAWNMIKNSIDKVIYPKYAPLYDNMIFDENGNIYLFIAVGPIYGAKKRNLKIYNVKGEKLSDIILDKKTYPQFFGKELFVYNGYMFYYDEQDGRLIKVRLCK